MLLPEKVICSEHHNLMSACFDFMKELHPIPKLLHFFFHRSPSHSNRQRMPKMLTNIMEWKSIKLQDRVRWLAGAVTNGEILSGMRRVIVTIAAERRMSEEEIKKSKWIVEEEKIRREVCCIVRRVLFGPLVCLYDVLKNASEG
jgi:hypothetical protein